MLKSTLRIVLALFFVGAGVNHFIRTGFFLRMIAAWGLIVLLVAVFPANVQMARHPETFSEFGPAALWLRLPDPQIADRDRADLLPGLPAVSRLWSNRS